MSLLRIKKGFTNLTHWFFILLFLLVFFFPGSPVKAVYHTPNKTGIPAAGITFDPTPVKKMCIGQSMVFGGMYTVGRNRDDLAPLTKGSVPISDIQIVATGNNGTIVPIVQPVYSNTMGEFNLKYTAEKEGDVSITVKLGNAKAGPIQFTIVKACRYLAIFFAKVQMTFSTEGTSIKETYRFNSGADLEPERPNDPKSDLVDKDAQMEYDGDLDEFTFPFKKDVTLSEKDYQSAKGHADGTATVLLYDKDVVLLMNKAHFTADSELEATISGKSLRRDFDFPDFLEEALFKFFNDWSDWYVDIKAATEGGKYDVYPKGLDNLCDYYNASPGFNCQYNAYVTLKKMGK